MRKKEDMLKDLGVSKEHNVHGGIPADTKEVIFAEIMIDIRDILNKELKRIDTWETRFIKTPP